jgi:hypothetical protein
MLGKLLKYELKATSRLFVPLYLTILVFATINRFFFPMYEVSEKSSSFSEIAMAISMVIYVSLMVGLVVMTLLVMIQRFYKNLLGDEGYLMFTLPVESWKHICSKLAISMFWILVSGIVALCSILIISSKHIFIPELYKDLSIAFDQFRQYFGTFSYLAVFEGIIFGLLSMASAILAIYAAIALGHLFNKHKLLISFGMYIILKTVTQIIMVLFGYIFTNQVSFITENYSKINPSHVNSILLTSILYTGVMTAGYFILTNYILKKKLNLE